MERWKFYLHGPLWLSMPEEFWPPVWPTKSKQADINVAAISTFANATPEKLISINVTSALVESDQPEENWILALTAKHELWQYKVIAVARSKNMFLAFMDFLKRKAQKQSMNGLKYDKSVTVPQYKAAESILIQAIQRKHFETEIGTLLKLGVTKPNLHSELRSKSSRLTSVNPFLDDKLVLRAGGRLKMLRQLHTTASTQRFFQTMTTMSRH